MAKRKAGELGEEATNGKSRRSSRRVSAVKASYAEESSEDEKAVSPKKQRKTKPKKEVEGEVGGNPVEDVDSKSTKNIKPAANATDSNTSQSGRQYWLMKAEPESRLEKGKDIKFSVDDLAAKTEPEPWDGIRAYPARNNLRAMKKGDLAFFYHSSCKVPAIVGIMEIVQEHTPDLSAHDPSAPYYDPKSSPDDPKWSVVHVEFRQKLNTPVTLKELKEWQSTKGNSLENMQMLKLARLSVSKVSEAEWVFLTSEMEKNGEKLLFK